MPIDHTNKLKEFLKSLDELREEVFYEYKRISGLKLEAQQPISGTLQQIEDALKVDLMMITQLRKKLTDYFNSLFKEFKSELESKLVTKERQVKIQLENALSNVDKLQTEMKSEEERIAGDIQKQLEEKYKQREQELISKLKSKRKEDLEKFKTQLKLQEEEMKKDLMETIDNVDKLRKELTEGSKNLENEIRHEVLKSTKMKERTLIKDLEKRMQTELENLESKYKSRVEILEKELKKAQKKIKVLRSLSMEIAQNRNVFREDNHS